MNQDLLGLPANQIITKGDDVDHANMLDLVDVRAQIAALIGLDPNTMDFDDDDVFGLKTLRQLSRTSASSSKK